MPAAFQSHVSQGWICKGRDAVLRTISLVTEILFSGAGGDNRASERHERAEKCRPEGVVIFTLFTCCTQKSFHLVREMCQQRTCRHGNTAFSRPMIGCLKFSTATTTKHRQSSGENKQNYHVHASSPGTFLGPNQLTLCMVVVKLTLNPPEYDLRVE